MTIVLDKDVAKKVLNYAFNHKISCNEIVNTLLRTEMERLNKVKEKYNK